ncbi:hypothetical protein HPULCUR_000032 [Helicostylum pulchrum]|uniref:DNA primase/nucleoside triphosphatase C-terminal domain-containing protein n=1 Tax=Helicostylum pulchrum TaxID=562976 RepID=A0ABP9XKF8_9FUNG
MSGLVNWALANPSENLNLLNNAVESNKLTAPAALSETNPLVEWISSFVAYKNGEAVNIGKTSSNPDTHLYAHYLRYCKDYGLRPLLYNVFSDSFLQQANILLSPDIYKRKTRLGTVIQNIILSNTIILETIDTSPSVSPDEEFEDFVN